MKLLSSLIRTPLGVLSVNIKMPLWLLDGREASMNNLVPETKEGSKSLGSRSGYLLIIATEGLFPPVF